MKNSILSEIQFANIILETYNLKIEQNNLIYYISQNVLNINEQFKINYEKFYNEFNNEREKIMERKRKRIKRKRKRNGKIL